MKSKKNKTKRVLGGIAKFIAILLETALLLVVGVYLIVGVVAKGPSPTAAKTLVGSLRQTSAIGFIADLYFTEDEIKEMESTGEEAVYTATDTTLVTIAEEPEAETDGPVADAWGLIDEDGDGLIIDPVKGEGYSGFMMVIKDPSRVRLGTLPNSYGREGYTVGQYAQAFNAIAAINAGGFYDPDGMGDGSIPDSLIVNEGKVYYANYGTAEGFVGIDSNYILHVASTISQKEIEEADIQYGVCFGPVLVSNGVGTDPSKLVAGLNPRTAIGQRSDGAILLLVIDGRQVISIGASYADLVDIMLEYGAVNALNLDGGSSSLMWYDGGYINNCASVIGIRNIPTSFVVLREGKNG